MATRLEERAPALRRWGAVPAAVVQRGTRVDGVLLLVIVGALAVRLWRLGDQSLWYDEWLTTEAARGGLRDLAHHVATREGIGPTYSTLMWGWVRLFGDNEVALRSLSVLFGVATVPAAYAAVRALNQSTKAARLAAVLAAFHPMLVWYSQEARPYTLLALLGALSLITVATAQASGQTAHYLTWGLVSALGVSVHYFALFLVVAEAALALLRRWSQRRQIVLGTLPVLACLAALAPLILRQNRNGGKEWIAEFDYTYRLRDVATSFLVGPNPAESWLWRPALAVVILAIALVIGCGKGSNRVAALFAAAAGTGGVTIAIVATTIGPDVLLSRYLIGSLVPLIVVVAIGLATGRTAVGGSGSGVVLSVVAGMALASLCTVWLTTDVAAARDPSLQKPDWRTVADVFEAGDGQRLLVMNRYANMGKPLHNYVPEAQELQQGQSSTAVRRIDVLVTKPSNRPCTFLIGRACGFLFLGASLPPLVAHDFDLEDRIELDQFIVERYTADHPVPLRRDDLIPPADPDQALVLIAGA